MKQFFTLLIAFFALTIAGQELQQNWKFTSITDTNKTPLFEIVESDTFTLTDSTFTYSLSAKDLNASGTYTLQNNLLTFRYNVPTDTIRYYNIVEVSGDTLILSENDALYTFSSKNKDSLRVILLIGYLRKP